MDFNVNFDLDGHQLGTMFNGRETFGSRLIWSSSVNEFKDFVRRKTGYIHEPNHFVDVEKVFEAFYNLYLMQTHIT